MIFHKLNSFLLIKEWHINYKFDEINKEIRGIGLFKDRKRLNNRICPAICLLSFCDHILQSFCHPFWVFTSDERSAYQKGVSNEAFQSGDWNVLKIRRLARLIFKTDMCCVITKAAQVLTKKVCDLPNFRWLPSKGPALQKKPTLQYYSWAGQDFEW